MNFIIPALVFAAIGLLAGVLLTVCSKVFEVKTDERIDKVNELLQIDWSDNIARLNAELLLRFLNLEEKI